MTKNFYRRHNEQWFDGKFGIMLRAVRNKGGEILEEGEIFIFSSKYGRGGFNIQGKSAYVMGVSYADVDLKELPRC